MRKPVQKKIIRVAVHGASGRMGGALVQLLRDDVDLQEHFQLVHASSGSHDPRFATILEDNPDIIIDFSAPKASLELSKVCARAKIPVLVCTTGFNEKESKALHKILKKNLWALAPNTSLGVFSVLQALGVVSKLLENDGYSFSIVESHHQMKKDAPSGTALRLSQKIQSATLKKISIPTHSIRGGNEIGDHSVIIYGPGERIEINHRANDRSLFARGALRLARRLLGKKRPKATGFPYNPEDLYGTP